MNIVKPQKILLDYVRKVDHLIDELKDHDEIENILIENGKEAYADFNDITIRKAIMTKVEMIESNLEKSTFMNVEFNHCNFSNTSFEGCYFIRCQFNNCKLTGCNFVDSRLKHVSFLETNMNYNNLSMASMENVLFENTGLRNSSFEENKLKNMMFKQADLTQAQFFKTRLNGIDFSDSVIDGIVVSIEDIKGISVNQFQAVDLVGLMGGKNKIVIYNCILMPVYPVLENKKRTEEQIIKLKEEHFKRIELADAILVVNVNNYIGNR